MTASTLHPGAPTTGSLPAAAPATAVVVARGVTPFVATTLRALAAQTRAPARVLLVDAGDRPDPGLAAVLRQAGLPAGTTTLLTAPGARTFGDAVRAAVAAEDDLPGGASRWLWLLHDDSAPDPAALAELVRAVQAAPSVGVAGVKQRTWTAPARLLEVGVRTSRSGRRMTDVEPGEVDQGQHDGREDVLGVGLVGALVRRDVWAELRGTDPALGPFGDGLDLSRRARLAGHRVLVVPSAVVRHAQAAYHGLRDPGTDPASIVDLDADGEPDGADPRRSYAARRAALLHQRLVWAPLPLVPFVAAMAVLAGLVRVLVRIATKEPALAAAELAAPLRALGRPAAVVRARAQARRTRAVPRRTLRPLQADGRTVWRQWRDRRLTRAEARRVVRAPSELELRELAALALRRRAGLAVVAIALVVVTAAAFGPLVVGTLSGESLVGGALVAASSGLGDVWAAATSGWVSSGLGSPGPGDALVTALLPGTAVAGGSLGVALAVLVLGSVLLSGLGAWFAAGAATRSVGVRVWAAVVWAALPSLLLAAGQGRAGAVLVHVALPWLALALARAVGAQQVDVVLSGVVTAARAEDGAVPGRDLGAEEWPDPEAWARAGEPARRRGRRAAGRGDDDAGSAAGATAAVPGATPAVTGSTPEVEGDRAEAADDRPTTGATPAVAADGPAEERDRDEASDVTPVRGTRAVPATTGAAEVVTARVPATDDAADDTVGTTTDDTTDDVADAHPDDLPATPARPAGSIAAAAGRVPRVRRRGRRGAGAAAARRPAPAGGRRVRPARPPAARRARRGARARPAGPAAGRGGVPRPRRRAAAGRRPRGAARLRPGVRGRRGARRAGRRHRARAVLAARPGAGARRHLVAGRDRRCRAAAGADRPLLRGAPVARAVRLGWVVAAVGLVAALVAGRVAVGEDDGTVVVGWAGSGVSLAMAGLLAAAVLGTRGARAWLDRASFGWRQLTAAVVTAVVVVLPLTAWVGWAWQARDGAAADLTTMDRAVVPAIGRQTQQSEDAPRVLALVPSTEDPASGGTAAGAVDWQLLRGDGPQVLESAAAARTAGLAGGLTDPAAAEPDDADAEVEAVVGTLAVGSSTDVAADLAALAVADVLVPPLPEAEDDLTRQQARTALIGRLDATPGLERITEGDSGVIWRVQPSGGAVGEDAQGSTADASADAAPAADSAVPAVVTAWARLVPDARATQDAAGLASADAVAVPAVPGVVARVDTEIEPGDTGRLLVLAERADAGWRATLDGRPLRAVTDGWRQTFEVGGEGGRLVVTHTAPDRTAWTVAQGAVGLLALLLALPVRRRRAGRR
ncbi:glycosyltransferase [Cellulomonas sp. Y8]|uniref:glycosyltransferase n=1 Tax=Cellulomonas sp. Y8 TaxID=2591145 RepID=UPI001FF04146|nr:glycosyltransferase [Cellulomonas sp. Y8]